MSKPCEPAMTLKDLIARHNINSFVYANDYEGGAHAKNGLTDTWL